MRATSKHWPRIRRRAVLVFVMVCFLRPSEGLTSNMMVGIQPSDGKAAFAQEFLVPVGTEISGVTFVSNDSRTVFPEVSLYFGSLVASPSFPVRSTLYVRNESDSEFFEVVWQPVRADIDRCFVVVRMPVGCVRERVGQGCGLGAAEAATLPSYFVGEGYIEPIRLSVSLDMTLTIGELGKSAAESESSYKEQTSGRGITLAWLGTKQSSISVILDEPRTIEVTLYDVSGRTVRKLVRGLQLQAGPSVFSWDGMNSAGDRVGRGVYIVELRSSGLQITQKLVRFW